MFDTYIHIYSKSLRVFNFLRPLLLTHSNNHFSDLSTIVHFYKNANHCQENNNAVVTLSFYAREIWWQFIFGKNLDNSLRGT